MCIRDRRRDHDAFHDYRRDGNHQHHHAPFVFYHQRHDAQHHALQRREADQRRQPAGAQRDEVQAHRQSNQQIQQIVHAAPPFHATSNANTQSRNAVVSSKGTRRKAARASNDSTSPTARVTTSTPAISAHAAASNDSLPNGSTACTSRTENSSNFIAAPCSTAANGGPLWSSTMTSWIIVSSRCVFGSSNGTRQFSASSTVNSPAASSTAPVPVSYTHLRAHETDSY